MKNPFFAFAFATSALVFSCGQQEQVAPASSPKSSARTSEVCVQPTNGIEFTEYVDFIGANVLVGGKTTISTEFNNPNHQYLVCLAKLDYLSGPNVYSEGWKEIHRVNESTSPIPSSSMFTYVTNNVLPVNGTEYRITYQVRTFTKSGQDCFSPEKVYTVDFAR